MRRFGVPLPATLTAEIKKHAEEAKGSQDLFILDKSLSTDPKRCHTVWSERLLQDFYKVCSQ